MKRLVSFLLGAVVVVGVLVLFIVFAHHSGPGDSPRDDNNAKPVAASESPSTTGTGAGSTSTTATETTSTGGGAAVSMTASKATFTSTCGGCHTLADAGTHGNVGPDLDQLKPTEAVVAHQITNGGGGMPAGLLKGAQLTSVSKYVSSVAGKSAGSSTTGAGGAP